MKKIAAPLLISFAMLKASAGIAQCTSPDVDLGNDTTLCTGQTMWLNAGAGYDTYQWNNGSTNATKFVSNPGGLYWVKVGTLGANIIVNGGFESGNTGFTTQYAPGAGGTFGLLSNPGTYAVTTSPNLVHNNFNSCQDHTSAPGTNQFVANGASTASTQVWCQSVNVSPNTSYQFGTWATSVETGQSPAQLQFIINNTQIGTVFSPSNNGCSWSQFTQAWNSGISTTAQICIVNQNTNPSGNDFAIDDITFRPICYSTDTIVVSYGAPPVVGLGADQQLCAGTPVTLDAQNPGSTYLWNTTETTQTISPAVSGTYSVTVTTPQGCSASDNVILSFEDQKHAGNDSSAVICSSENQFDLAAILSPSATTGGTWAALTPGYAGTVSPAGIASLMGQSATFGFQYVVHGTFCPNDTSQLALTINQQPVAAADQAIHVCNTVGDAADFSPYLVHPSAPLPGAWSTSANVPAGAFDAATNALDLSGLPDDSYAFDFILPADQGCVQDTMTVNVDVTAVPVIQFSSDLAEGCQPLAITFVNESIAQGNVLYTWDLGDGTTAASPATVSNTYEAAQCYDITLTALADGLCSATQTVSDMICVHAVPLADFSYGPQQVFSDGPLVEFTNTSVDHDFSAWDFGDGNVSAAEHPEHMFPIGEIGNYEVELIVTTSFGCSDTTSRVIVVKDQLLYYVPNTFTPDADQFNPVFLPVMTAGMDENDYHLEIYNRWGEIVFQTGDIHEGWDGSFGGRAANEGTYTWKLRFGLIDDDSAVVATGHVNLVR
jgi:gliding motility-associated-like protein